MADARQSAQMVRLVRKLHDGLESGGGFVALSGLSSEKFSMFLCYYCRNVLEYNIIQIHFVLLRMILQSPSFPVYYP